MVNLFLFYAPLFSALALFLLWSVGSLNHAPIIQKILFACIMLVAFISSLFLVKVAFFDQALLLLGQNSPLIAWDLRLILSQSNIALIATSTLSLIVALFLINDRQMLEGVKLLALMLFFLMLTSMPANLFIAASIYVIGKILISYAAIKTKTKDNKDKKIEHINFFILNRISDILLFGSLLYILSTNNNLSFAMNLKINAYYPHLGTLFLGLSMRLFMFSRGSKQHIEFLENFYSIIGALFLLLQVKNIIFNFEELKYLFFFMCLIILTHALFIFCIKKNTRLSAMGFAYLHSSAIFILICAQYYLYAFALLCLLILLLPIFLLMSARRTYQAIPSDIFGRFGSLIQTSLGFGAELADKIIGPFYAVFLLYRFPQFIVSLFQLPIRVFHNGNLQRSLMFIALILASYYSLWG